MTEAGPKSAPLRILFLAANPDEMTNLNLGKEMREVEDAIARGSRRESFELRDVHEVKIGELQHLLDRFDPAIVHFGGHGSDSREEIVLRDEHDRAFPVDADSLADLLKTREGIVLNACSSANQAQLIAQRGATWAIGMGGRIKTTHAVVFARAFYRKLADGYPVEEAFVGAKLQLRLEGHKESAELPQLFRCAPETTLSNAKNRVDSHPVEQLSSRDVEKTGELTSSPARRFAAPPPSPADVKPSPGNRAPAILNPFGEGDVAAELDILSHLYFVDTDFPKKALSDKVNLIIGRRGAGKTALAHWFGLPREAQSRYYGVYVDVGNMALFAPTVTGIADRLKMENHAAETLSSAWRVALLHALMVETLKDKHLASRPGSLDMEHHLINKSIPKAQSASHVILRVFQIVVSSLAPGISVASSLVASVQKLETSPGFVAWKKVLPEYLKGSKQRAVIVIDTLEEYRIKDQAVQLSMASLSHAVSEISKGGGADGVEIKLFIPAEVSQTLEDTAIMNIGKTFDRALFMHWRRKDVLRLMSWRLMYYLTTKCPEYCPADLKRYRELDWSDHSAISKNVWERFFPEGTRDGHAISSFAHISRFTQLRPRQFVLLCNAIAQQAHENRTFPKIQWKDLGNGIADVVDLLAREVLSSFRNVYADADRIVGALATARDPQSLYVGLSYGNVDSLASQVKSLCSREEFWRLLLETGVLGVVTRDTEIYTEARFEYIVRQPLVPNVNDRFVVHPMFYGRLGVKPPSDAKWVFPIGPEDLSVEY